MKVAFLIILFFSLFASQKLFSDKFYTSHDGGGHVIRMIEFDQALKDGQFPVRLAKRINHGLSYPYFNFNYPFIYYLSSLIHLFGFSFVTVFKIIMFASVLMGGIAMYLFTRLYFDEVASVISAIFYIIAPYRFLNMYVRGTVAETFALSLLPLLFLSVERVVRKEGVGVFVVVTSLLILSHNITALFALPLGMIYFLIRTRKDRNKYHLYRQIGMGMIVSLLLTAFFWVPAMVENGLTKLVELTEDYREFFPSIKDIVYSPWGFGAFKQGDVPGKMSPQIGLVHSLISLIALGLLAIRIKINKKVKAKDAFLMIFLALSLTLFFLMSPSSLFLWDNSYFLKLVQHPWRLVGYVVLGASVAAGYIISCIERKQIKYVSCLFLMALLLYANRNHIRVNQYIDFEDPFAKSQVYGPSTTSKDEHIPKKAPRVYTDPNPDGDVLPPSLGFSKRLIWKSNYHLFEVDTQKEMDFRDNTWNFPGWRAKVDGKEVKIDQNDELVQLRIHLLPGRHRVEFFFGETWYRLLADMVSVVSISSLLLIFSWRRIVAKSK